MADTEFSRAVKEVVQQIPRGSTMSYQGVAETAGHPRAYRAVASVMANNHDKDVPCHRVIKSNGAVGDYNRGGSTVKRRLLENEGAIIK